MNKKTKTLCRFDQVKQILNRLQGNKVPQYQGYNAFWMDLSLFKTVVIYGQRMIAPDPNDNNQGSSSNAGCCGGTAGADDTVTSALGPAEEAVIVWPQPQVADPNCWPSGGSGHGNGTTTNKDTSRSSASAIIRGLQGLSPFDNSQFPPLMWEGIGTASAQDIAFIAQWIDDGCPETDNIPDSSAAPNQALSHSTAHTDDCIALACGDKAHPVSQKSTNIDTQTTKGLNVRKEISTLNQAELKRLCDALKCMYQYNGHWQDERSFDFWARVHANSCEHGWEQFLPWHRAYLYFFEQQLQDFDPLITIPYWSWTDYADANTNTFNTQQLDMGVIPEAFRCYLDNKAIDNLHKSALFDDKQMAQLQKMAKLGTTYNSGVRLLNAAKIPYSLLNPNTLNTKWSNQTSAIYNELRRANPLWFPNRWPGSTGGPLHYPTKANVNNIMAITNWSDFGGGPTYDHHYGELEQVHNGMHLFSGGANPYFGTGEDAQNPENPQSGWMTDNRVTAFDPIFWAHHCNIDRLWARWQTMHPNTSPEELDGILAPWSLTVQDTLSVKKLGYEYMRDSFHYQTASNTAITRFKSEKSGVRSTVLDQHAKAEVRLHRVQVSNLPSAIIRVYLNEPDACNHTSIINNDHYVGQITTFHGSCYGGPGHCNLPLEKSRRSDQRQLHHHEPRNYRLDASDTVKRLLAKGEDDLSVHLVVVGIDGQPIDNALFLDGVSLNFFD